MSKYEIVNSFILKKEMEVKKSSLDSYESDIALFLDDLKTLLIQEKKCNNDISEEELIEKLNPLNAQRIFVYYTKEKRLAVSSLARKSTSLKMFGRFLKEDYGVKNINVFNILPSFKVRQVQKSIEHHESLQLDNVRKLIDVIDIKEKSPIKKARLKFIIAMMNNCGNRINELCNLKFNQIEKKSDNVYMINYVGDLATKEGIDKRIPIVGKALDFYKEWLVQREKINIHQGLEDYVLIADRGGKLDRGWSNYNIKKYCKLGHITEKNICNHSFRGTCRENLERQGVGQTMIKIIEGWSRDVITDSYMQDGKELDDDKIKICNIL